MFMSERFNFGEIRGIRSMLRLEFCASQVFAFMRRSPA
jgi:hypothetical protein